MYDNNVRWRFLDWNIRDYLSPDMFWCFGRSLVYIKIHNCKSSLHRWKTNQFTVCLNSISKIWEQMYFLCAKVVFVLCQKFLVCFLYIRNWCEILYMKHTVCQRCNFKNREEMIVFTRDCSLVIISASLVFCRYMFFLLCMHFV